MGINEYDRIRNKNKVQQLAYDYYTKLSGEGLSDEAISNLMGDLLNTESDSPRNEIYSTVLKIIGGSNENPASTPAVSSSVDSE